MLVLLLRILEEAYDAAMEVKILKIGNSRGIRIPVDMLVFMPC
jgi:hypothetical protein